MSRTLSFILFLSVFLTLYGLLHLYFYRKFLRAFDPGTISHITLIFILCCLLFSPILTYMISETGHPSLTRIVGFITYIWMGVLFLFFTVNLLVDIYRLVIYIAGRIFTPFPVRYVPGQTITFIVTSLLVIGVVIYGSFEAANIGVDHLRLRSSRLPAGMDHFRIVQISDIHFSPTNGIGLARKITGMVEELRSDILLSTGDLIDRGLQDRDAVASLFRHIQAPYGKFATTGNHEFIAGIEYSTEFTEKAGFRMLRNESVSVGTFLHILAVDDPAGERFGMSSVISEKKVLESYAPDGLNIFLKHQPRVETESIGRFDIQLSGHTHKGQIFPFSLFVSLFYSYMDGLYEMKDGSYLYVSRGTGTWGPPIRFLSPPVITVIDYQPPDHP